MKNIIDWNEKWKRDLLGTSWRSNPSNPVEMWNKKAPSYNKMITKRISQTEQILKNLDIGSNDTVLDIGSGPGTLTLPLAKIASEVTAVDLSSVMLDCIRDKADIHGFSHIHYVNKSWEDVTIGTDFNRKDVILACHCLIMPDMRAALEKMNDAAKRQVYLFRFAGKSGWDYEKIWKDLYMEDYNSNPDYIYIVNILHQMGIYADVKILDQKTVRIFSSYDEATEDFMENLPVHTESGSKIVLDYMKKILRPDKGVYYYDCDSKVAMISWKK